MEGLRNALKEGRRKENVKGKDKSVKREKRRKSARIT